MTIQDKMNQIENDFKQLSDWEKKYERIIQIGKTWSGLSDDFKTEDLKIKGCQSQVWIKSDLKDGRLHFLGDSDALLVKGLVALVITVYSGESPEAILATEPTFLKNIGLDSGLSPSRANGLYTMIKQIKYYATAYQYLLNQKK